MMMCRLACLSALLCAALAPLSAADDAAAAAPQPNKWEAKIAAFEKADAEHPPPKGEVLFLGSSSIVGWNLSHWFPELVALNRGFGGSKIADSIYFFDRVVVPYAPQTVVFYADFRTFGEKLTAALPACKLLYLSIKPSGKRWNLRDKIEAANKLIAEQCEANSNFRYVELGKLLLDEQGQWRPELFKDDKLHLNAAGYAIWSAALAPLLDTTAATE